MTEPIAEQCKTARDSGAVVIPQVFDDNVISKARATVLGNLDFMRNTRAAPSSRHLAGFHRFPVLEPLHLMITANSTIRQIIRALCGPAARTIGISDITVNRSQQWHKDLLRGKFRQHLADPTPCANGHGSIYKVIVYLQDSDSLKIIPGSQRQDIDLSSDEHAIPDRNTEVRRIKARTGDAVIIDICTTHRGSADAAFENGTGAAGDPGADAKILVSTVFASANGPLTNAMELGNAARLADWMSRNTGL
jgi:hypothetical protein